MEDQQRNKNSFLKSRENVCMGRKGLDWKQTCKILHKNDFQPRILCPAKKINLVSGSNKYISMVFITFFTSIGLLIQLYILYKYIFA